MQNGQISKLKQKHSKMVEKQKKLKKKPAKLEQRKKNVEAPKRKRKKEKPSIPTYPIDRKGYWFKEEPLVETSNRVPRKLTPFEENGRDILFTIKTTQTYHKGRIQLLLDTWLSVVNASNVYLVTDGYDQEYSHKAKEIGKSCQFS